MLIEEYLLKINDFDTVKISIWDDFIQEHKVYYAKCIDVNIESYASMKDYEKSLYYGLEFREEENNSIVYYSDKDLFIKDIEKTMNSGRKMKSQLK